MSRTTPSPPFAPIASSSSPTGRSSTSSRARPPRPSSIASRTSASSTVRRVTIKGLLAHKLRFALTALAVMLGVAFMSGTMVLTDTISRTFDNLFADVNRGTDAYVPSALSLSSGCGGPVRRQRARVPASLVPQIEAVPGAAAAQGNLQFYAQLVDKKGKTVGNPQRGAPTFGFTWGTVKALNPYRLEPGGHAPVRTDQVVIDAGSAKSA